MIQVSEFGIVVGVAAVAGGFIGVEVLGFLALVALITMGISVYFFTFGHSIFTRVQPYTSRFEAGDTITEDKRSYTDHAVVIGYDDVTRNLLSLLDESFDEVVIVDRRPDHVNELTDNGYDVIFGDIARSTIRKSVSLEDAAFVLSSSDQREIGEMILQETAEDTIVIVEARTAAAAQVLYDRGADYVVHAGALTADRLATYLHALLEDRDLFDRAAMRDEQLLRDPEPFRAVHRRMVGELDD